MHKYIAKVIKYKGREIGRVHTNHSMTFEEICKADGIELAVTEEDYMGVPGNGKFLPEDLEIEEVEISAY